ncbi:MAG: (Fe-S)-binding protein [Pigmentiphaga sp.]|nr:(Fe-S)-binding protein [Pigmentiphaga sp.]
MDTSTTSLPLEDFVGNTLDAIASACTRCGRCVEVCPVVPYVGLNDAKPAEVVDGVIEFSRGKAKLRDDSGTWITKCNGCGDCIPACPEGINPRQLISLASARVSGEKHPTPYAFRKMARAIRIMIGMQLLPAEAARLVRPPKKRDADVIFYTGCNPVRTPHVLFNSMTVLDELGIDYEVMGGTASCCGIVHSKWEGDLKAGGRFTEGTLQRFGDFKPQKVLNWCPSCQIHLTETMQGYRKVEFDFEHITRFLVEHEAELISRFLTPVKLNVLVHTHHGMHDVGAAVLRLLKAIPGLNVIEELMEPAYMCGASGSERAPEMKAGARQHTIERSLDPSVDALVSLYHACHLQLAADGRRHGFRVINFTDLLVRALGGEPCPDTVETYRLIGDWRAMVKEAAPLLKANGIDMDPEELAEVLPEVFSSAEFRGGLCRFAPQEK